MLSCDNWGVAYSENFSAVVQAFFFSFDYELSEINSLQTNPDETVLVASISISESVFDAYDIHATLIWLMCDSILKKIIYASNNFCRFLGNLI